MRRPKRSTSQAISRVRWMAPISPGEASPMDKLMAWLERNGEVYRTSKRKLDMLGQLNEELETSGIYGLTVSSIRSQLTRLKHRVKLKAEGGTCTSTDANHYYDRLLATLFDEDERAAMRARAVERAAEEGAKQSEPSRRPFPRTNRRTPSRPREATQEGSESTDESDAEEQESELGQDAGANLQPTLDTTEIRRRFELLSARQSLQRQGVDQAAIDSMLPRLVFDALPTRLLVAQTTVLGMVHRGSHSTSRLSWLEAAPSSGGLSPMQLLVAWLSHHYATYASSNTKVEMLEELCQGMRVAGYPSCTVYAIRSKIDAVRREARRERVGDHHHSRAFQEFQQPLMGIFATDDDTARELDTSDTETDEESSAVNGVDVKPESIIQDGLRSTPLVAGETVNSGDQGAGVSLDAGARRHRRPSLLDVTEIQRRFLLVCARHGLEQRGIATEIIDRFFPLPDE